MVGRKAPVPVAVGAQADFGAVSPLASAQIHWVGGAYWWRCEVHRRDVNEPAGL